MELLKYQYWSSGYNQTSSITGIWPTVCFLCRELAFGGGLFAKFPLSTNFSYCPGHNQGLNYKHVEVSLQVSMLDEDGTTLLPWACGQLLVWDAICPADIFFRFPPLILLSCHHHLIHFSVYYSQKPL